MNVMMMHYITKMEFIPMNFLQQKNIFLHETMKLVFLTIIIIILNARTVESCKIYTLHY